MKVIQKPQLRILLYVFLLAIIVGLLPLASAAAQGIDTSGITDDQVNAIAKQLFCPVCESTPLDVCGTQACAQWRELIREKLAEGWTEDQIKDYFANQYGDRVLAEPPARGLNWLVYVIPPLVFFAGAFFLYRGFTTWRNLADEPDGEPEPENESEVEDQDEYLARLEAELKKQK